MNSEKPERKTTYENEVDKVNSRTEANTFCFGILLLITQVFVTFMYGFFENVPSVHTSTDGEYKGSLLPVFLNFGMLFVVLVGFALIFSYVRRLVWSSIGFSLLITCLTIELYFLINAFWVKVEFGGEGRWEDQKFSIYLSNIGIGDEYIVNHKSLSEAIRCSLANVIAFSSILGKAGPLEAWIVSLLGTFGYVLNKKVILLLGIDYGGTFSVFTFGAFFGLLLSIMINCRYKGQIRTARNRHYFGSIFSVSLSLMGNTIVWALFPILVMDPALDPRFDLSLQLYTVPLNILMSMAGSTLMATSISLIINQALSVRDLVQAPSAGAVAICSAAFYIIRPVYAIGIGCLAGLIQTLFQNFVEKRAARKHQIIHTFSFIFGIQGIFGCIYAAVFRAILKQTEFTEDIPDPVFSFTIFCISAAIAAGFGLITGLILFCLAKQVADEHFHDYTYWVNNDGIRYPFVEEEEHLTEKTNLTFIRVKETNKDIKNRHAYI